MAKQGASYEDIIKTEGEEGEEQENNHGNTRLPFGLCAKYGIPLPEGATPRDAWNALKGKGIHPPWTEEGKDQYDGDDAIIDDTNEIGDDGVKISPTRKQTYDNVRNRLIEGKFSEGYQKTLNDILMNLSDDELKVFALTDNVKINHLSESADVSFCRGGANLFCQEAASDVDKMMGYDVGMSTIGHEYGHAVDYAYEKATGGFLGGGSKISQLDDCKQAYEEDVLGYFNKACEDAGVKTMNSINRISSEQKEAIWKKMAKDSAKDKTYIKTASNFIKVAPSEPWGWNIDTDEDILKEANRMKTLYGFSDEKYENYIKQQKERRDYKIKENERDKAEYERKLAEYNKYMESDEYKKGWQAYQDYRKDMKENKIKYNAQLERYGIISDFIGEITNGKFNVLKGGYSAHSVNYYKERPNGKGMETWATYFGMKTTRDVEGLNMMKELLPKTYQAYEKHYQEIPNVLSNKEK